MTKKYWFTSSCGRIEFQLTKKQVLNGSYRGHLDNDIAELLKLPSIKKQLSNINPDIIKSELKGYGAWDDIELSNHDNNLARILWIACCDIREENNF